jgi:predicted dehydrogenase
VKVRWGIIGAGGIAEKRVIPALLYNGMFTLEAIVRTDQVKLIEMQERFGIRNGYLSIDELLANPGIDAVYIASPVHLHAEHAIRCAQAGKMVLIEKPVGLNQHEVEAIRTTCRENRVFFDGALMMRYHQLHERMREMIQEGWIGSPVTARIEFRFQYPPDASSWRQIKKLGGGGVMMDLGPHCLDLLQFVLGRKINSVRGAIMNTITYSYEVEDSASILLELEGGVHAFVSVHFNVLEAVSPTKVEIFGTEGWILAEGTLGQVEQGSLHYKRIQSSETGSMTVDSDAGQFTEDENPHYSLYSKEFAQFEKNMGDTSCWEALMEEQLALQMLIDDAYSRRSHNNE